MDLEAGPPGILKQQALGALGRLPPFSPILNRLLASMAEDNVSFARLGDLIEKDTVIAASLLHLVNSALYARRGTINSVRHALSLLGVEKVRNAVLGMSLTRMWSRVNTPPSWSMARFNTHSAATAILSDLLAQRLPAAYPEGAFVAGLLHDVGRLLIALGLPEQHQRIDDANRLESEREVLGFTHAELSAAALAAWNLPDPIRAAVLHHHAPDSGASSAEPGTIRLSRILAAANNYVNAEGMSVALVGDPLCSDRSGVERLGIGADALQVVLREFRTEYDILLQFFR